MKLDAWSFSLRLACNPRPFQVLGSGVDGEDFLVLNQNSAGTWALNGKDNPAAKGSAIVIYLTGGGTLSPTTANGTVIAAPASPALPPTTAATASVTVDGKPCAALYSGAVDGSIAGLVQVNCTLDSTLTKKDAAALVVTYSGQASQSGVTIAVKE